MPSESLAITKANLTITIEFSKINCKIGKIMGKMIGSTGVRVPSEIGGGRGKVWLRDIGKISNEGRRRR